MDAQDQVYLASVLQKHRDHLEEVLAEIAERRHGPLSIADARLLIDETAAHLSFVEHALRDDAELQRLPTTSGLRRIVPARVRRVLGRIRGLRRPRIGRLRHYAPRPLLVPASYLTITPPEPAPTISIVTPSYQQGRFLERTIGSVLGQGYPALEYVVQDGGSTDETVDILRRLDGRLTRWASEPDSGQADAINRGFLQARGEIMAWLNADDLLLPGALAYVARYFAEHPEVDVIYGDRLMIDSDDSEIGAWILPRHDNFTLSFADYVPQETLFWRRKAWEAAGGAVDTEFHYAMDWDLLLRFVDAGACIVHVPRFLGAFRVHDEQKTTADAVRGAAECARLRRRVHGRPVAADEIVTQLRPYLRRHVRTHLRYRIRTRLALTTEDARFAPQLPVPAPTLGRADFAPDVEAPAQSNAPTPVLRRAERS